MGMAVGVGHLTMLDIAPPHWVGLAHEAGFEAVGIRVAVASPGEEPWPMAVGSVMLAETRRRLDDTGMRVLEVEIVRLTPETRAADFQLLLDVGSHLDAQFVSVLADDPDLARVHDNFAGLAEQARPFGLRPLIEPIAYTTVRNLDHASTVADGTGGGITLDPLIGQRTYDHPQDFASTLEAVTAGTLAPEQTVQARFPVEETSAALAAVREIPGKSWIDLAGWRTKT